MTIQPTDVLNHFKRLHREIESDAGEDPQRVTDDVKPFDGLAGFDSPLIPSVVRTIAKEVGITLAPGVRLRNPYVGSEKQTLTLREVATRFCEFYGSAGKAQ